MIQYRSLCLQLLDTFVSLHNFMYREIICIHISHQKTLKIKKWKWNNDGCIPSCAAFRPPVCLFSLLCWFYYGCITSCRPSQIKRGGGRWSTRLNTFVKYHVIASFSSRRNKISPCRLLIWTESSNPETTRGNGWAALMCVCVCVFSNYKLITSYFLPKVLFCGSYYRLAYSSWNQEQ